MARIARRNAYRTLDAAVCILVHEAGDLWVPASTVAEIDGFLARAVDPRDGAELATVITCDAEVNDAAIQYGDLDRGQVNARLRELGIIVRAALLLGTAAGLTTPPPLPPAASV